MHQNKYQMHNDCTVLQFYIFLSSEMTNHTLCLVSLWQVQMGVEAKGEGCVWGGGDAVFHNSRLKQSYKRVQGTYPDLSTLINTLFLWR